jgi:hypothetical protein
VGKKVQKLTADLGVIGIVEGKLGGGSSSRYRAVAARCREWRWWSSDWSAVRRRKLVRELRRGDAVLMVLLVRAEKGRRVRSPAWCSGLRVCGRRKKSGSRRAVRCGGAGGARNLRGGAAKTVDG